MTVILRRLHRDSTQTLQRLYRDSTKTPQRFSRDCTEFPQRLYKASTETENPLMALQRLVRHSPEIVQRERARESHSKVISEIDVAFCAL